jgi:hypothetical protein
MADWGKWVVTDTYTNIPTLDAGKDEDAVRLNDSRVTAATNLPAYAKRWNNGSGVFENWISPAWSAIIIAIAGGGTGASTAAGARTNLGVPSVSEAQATAQGLVDTHNAVTSAHSATPNATASRIAMRDGAGRMQVAEPSASSDVATKNSSEAAASAAVSAHQAVLAAHSAAYSAIAGRIIVRDSAGRAQVVSPSAGLDIATKEYVDNLVPLSTSGVYTPSWVNVQNVSTITFHPTMYYRIGSIVTVAGGMIVSPTTQPDFVIFYLTLPIASDLQTIGDLSGIGNFMYATNYGGLASVYITGDPSGNRARFYTYANDDTFFYPLLVRYSFFYRVL